MIDVVNGEERFWLGVAAGVGLFALVLYLLVAIGVI